MAPTVVLVVLLALAVAYTRIRRHRNWRARGDARFFMMLGYPATAIALYWMSDSSQVGWVSGLLWSLAAFCCFVYGFNALNSREKTSTVSALTGTQVRDVAGGHGHHIPAGVDAQPAGIVHRDGGADEHAITR